MDNREERYSEYLKQFKTEVAKEIDIDIDAQKSPKKALPMKAMPIARELKSPHDRQKKS